MENNYFVELNKINVNDKTEKKNGLTYLSWAWAWGEVKKLYPDAIYTIYETTNPEGYVINYFTDGRTCWVKTGVTVNGIENIEELPVMDFKNKSIPLNNVTSFDVNKAIQRSLTKAVARHGLGLYIYAGEDLPEEESKDDNGKKKIDEKKVNPDENVDTRKQDRIELEKKCAELGIDLNSLGVKAYIEKQLELSSGRKTLDENFNLGQYNAILNKILEKRGH